MGQSDTTPGANDTQKVPADQRDAVTTDHTIQNPAQAPGTKQPENTAGVRSTTTTEVETNPGAVGTQGNREAQKVDASQTGGERASGVPAPKEGGPESRR